MHIYLNFTSEFGASQCNMWNDCWIKILSHYSGKKIYKALIHWLSNYWKQYPHLARKHICHSSDLLCTREYALSLICVGPLSVFGHLILTLRITGDLSHKTIWLTMSDLPSVQASFTLSFPARFNEDRWKH